MKKQTNQMIALLVFIFSSVSYAEQDKYTDIFTITEHSLNVDNIETNKFIKVVI